MANVVDEIRNWHLFTDKFGDDYQMHDAVIKRFDLNKDELTIVVNTLYEMDDEKVYDITLKFSKLISFDYDTEIGNDYIYGMFVKKDDYYKNLFSVTFDSVGLNIRCFKIEVISIVESEPFQRGMICLENPNQTGENDKMMWRT